MSQTRVIYVCDRDLGEPSTDKTKSKTKALMIKGMTFF